MTGFEIPISFQFSLTRIDQHPYVLLASFYILVGLLMAYTPPASTPRRFAVVIAGFYTAFILYYSDKSFIGNNGKEFFGHCTIGLLIYSSYWLCIIKVAPGKRNPVSETELTSLDLEKALPDVAPSLVNYAKWAYNVLANPRGIGTDWQCRNLPVFSIKNPDWAPSRRRFIISQAVTSICFFTVMQAYESSLPYLGFQDEDFSPAKASFFRRIKDVTPREMLIRVFIVLDCYLPQYFLYRGFRSLVGAASVIMGNTPASWPPLFGGFRHAYSLRGFWSKFWHLLYYRAFVANSAVVTHQILRILKKSQFGRFLIITLAFMLSAVVHSTGDIMTNAECMPYRLVIWYLFMSQIIVVELLAEAAFSYVSKDRTSPIWMSGWWNPFGYLWVLCVFGWSIPKMQLPNTDCAWKMA